MRTYETTFIINPQADDAAIDKQVNDVIGIIKDNGGTILWENRLGTRRLAYEIQGLNQGYYTHLIFDGTNEILNQMDRFYKLEESYVRHLTVRFDGDIPIKPITTEEVKESDKKEEVVKSSGRREEPGDHPASKSIAPSTEPTEAKTVETIADADDTGKLETVAPSEPEATVEPAAPSESVTTVKPTAEENSSGSNPEPAETEEDDIL